MKTKAIKLRQFLPEIIVEAHQRGEWWIDDVGEIDSAKQQTIGSPEEAMKERWKRMKASKNKIEIFTWELKAEDLRIIIKGIKAIMNQDPNAEPTSDSDEEVEKDGYTGPRVDITIKSKDKQFKNVPLAILEKCLPSNMKNYEAGKNPELAGSEELREGYHHHHKEYRLYEARDHIIALFEDNSRLVFEVHYHENRGEDKEKWRRRAFSKWKTLANEIHRDVQLTEVGNPKEKSWKQAFEEALNHPELQEFIRKPHHQKVFDDN